MLRRSVLLLALAALVFPATAAAEKLEVQGPLAIKGHGFLRGELETPNPAETKPVRFRGQGGFIRLVDLGGDLKVRCQGRGEMRSGENDEGQTVVVCMGRGGRAAVSGSHYRLFVFAHRYQAFIPEGVSGTLQGRFRSCSPGSSDDEPETTAGEDEQTDEAAGETASKGCGPRGGKAGERQKALKERAKALKERAKERAKELRQRAKERAKELRERAQERAKERKGEKGQQPGQPGQGDEPDESDGSDASEAISEIQQELAAIGQ